MRTHHFLARFGVLALSSFVVLTAASRDADACGGCFHPPRENPTVVTDHRMIFAVTPKQTTLYDQMRYTGAPSSFAWVLPIAGQVTIGLSSDELFNVLDSQTSVQVLAPELRCYMPPTCTPSFDSVAVAAPPSPGGGGGGGGVTVLAHEVVGPYETVQLKATDPKALSTWLAAHKYEISPEAQTIIDAYVNEKSAFLAMKLVPGATVQAMRPVRVTAPGASMMLPLRMVAAGAGATLGVTLWVVSDGRYEPQNFPAFTIGADEVAWDWKTSSSNYSTVRAAKTKNNDGRGWQIESSLDLSTMLIENQLSAMGRSRPITPPKPVAPTAPTDAGAREKSPDEERSEDLGVLFGGGVRPNTIRVTRMRADLSHAGLNKDLQVQASANQAVLSNVVQVVKEVAPPLCPVYDNKCAVVGNAPRDEAEAKNKALSNPQYPSNPVSKKLLACGASPGFATQSGEALLVALVIAGAAITRKRRRG